MNKTLKEKINKLTESEYINKLVGFFNDFFGIIASLIAIISATSIFLASILSYITKNKMFTIEFFCIVLCIMVVILICVCIILLFKIKQYKYSLWNRMNVFSRAFYKILNDFIIWHFKVIGTYKNAKKSNSNEQNIKHITDVTTNNLKLLLNEICNIYSVYTGVKINSCIKIIDNLSNSEININNAEVKTFVRSENIAVKRSSRKEPKHILVKDNTDFKFIINPPEWYTCDYFYVQNIDEFNKFLQKEHNMKYENTTFDYDNFYRAAIVYPIKIENKQLFFNENAKDGYSILGFLCIDTLSTDAFISEYEENFISIASASASICYLVLNKYQYYLKKLKV